MKRAGFIFVSLLISILICVSVSAKNFEKSRVYSDNFSDVPKNSWFASSVGAVYEAELMEGVSENVFDTDSEMSVSQAITIAARLHSIYNETEIPEVQGGRWFQKYVAYCLDNKIMTENQFDSYSRSVLSYEMVELFAAALPKEFYPALNKISSIHDVPAELDFCDDILLFYNAGILNGNDSTGTFLPMSAITRKRAAVILSRTALPANRLSFSLEEPKNEYTASEVLSLIAKQTVPGALDTIVLASYGNIEITASEYRYYSFITGGDSAKTENEIKFAVAVEKSIKDMNITVSRRDYEAILVSYYNPRTGSYGNTSYFDSLDAQRLTDSAFAKLITLNKLRYLALEKECTDISADEVYAYAVDNGYICAKNILISDDSEDAYKKALEIKLSLADGASFDELLDKYGEDPGMKERNGGYIFTKGWMVKEFEEAAYGLDEGEISGVVETVYGYHIIKRLPLGKKELASSPDYASVAASAGTKKFEDRISSLTGNVTLTYIENFEGLSQLLK